MVREALIEDANAPGSTPRPVDTGETTLCDMAIASELMGGMN
jgi:hypothetical protein